MGIYFDPAVETMPREELEKLQLERLKWQATRCCHNSPFYKNKMDRAGVVPENMKTLEDIQRIPFVTKDELRQEQEEYPPLGRYVLADPEEWGELHPSTGTTGRPVNTIWSHGDTERITDFTARVLYGLGVRKGDIIQNGFSYGLWVAGMSTHYAAQKMKCFIIPIGAAMSERHIEYLVQLGPTFLAATPSFALYIAERIKEQGINPRDLQLRGGFFGGEGGTESEATRHKLESRLGIDAYDIYGLAEIGPTMAAECTEKAGLHWTEDHHLIEIINPETNEPCNPGELGILVITHLTREATPMLRYWSNDYASITYETCRCGRTHARSEGGIVGRADDLIIYRGAKFYPLQVEKIVRSFNELSDEFKIVLFSEEGSGLESCTIQVELVAGASEKPIKEQLTKALKEELLVTPQVEYLPHGSLERTTFKAKRILDQRKK